MKRVPILMLPIVLSLQNGCATQDARKNEGPVSASTAITGFARDEFGARLPGVEVELKSSSDSAIVLKAITNVAGEFVFANMPAGTYRLTFTLNGFRTVARDATAKRDTFTALEVALPLADVKEMRH